VWIEGLKPTCQDTKNCASSEVEHKSGEPVKSGHNIIILLMKFTRYLRELHVQAISRIGRYLMPNEGEKIIFQPENGQDMNYHVKQTSAEI